ncbi:hypothetical protein BD410DRAFT_807382 [Rickenella mellea]|uniref:Uncharacterized protein n=1 Tax=Rickenella mellea TaxID=50990 RepID=A0A4Y7PQL6_9AGAM|nr:hypothetical protein BD410DRAFT_807382 [Rickenella mellea]
MTAIPQKPATHYTWNSLEDYIKATITGFEDKGYEVSIAKSVCHQVSTDPLEMAVTVYAGKKMMQDERTKGESEQDRKGEVFLVISTAMLVRHSELSYLTQTMAKNWLYNVPSKTISCQCEIVKTEHENNGTPSSKHSKDSKIEMQEIMISFQFSGGTKEDGLSVRGDKSGCDSTFGGIIIPKTRHLWHVKGYVLASVHKQMDMR